MAVTRYEGIAYRQGRDPATPWLVSIVVPAEELLRWAGIPRRTEGHEIGFQRTEKRDRVDKARKYFQESPKNQSPTALVVGVHPVPSGGRPSISIEFLSGNDSSPIRPCRLSVDFAFESAPLESVVDHLKAQLQMRLAATGEPRTTDDDAEAEALERAASDDSALESDEDDDTDAEGADREVEVARSLLGEFLEKLHNPVWCQANETHLREIAKPATVIDGQHRVLGAAECERSLPFAVCAIYNCEWAEQVFQFTVVNYTAKGIPDQFITANAALSLTTGELSNLEARLVQAGVKVVEYELMRVVNFTEASPFFDMINLTESKQPDKIGYKTMVRVARIWYDARHHALRKVLRQLYPDIRGKHANSRRLARWKDEDWGDFFLTFWSTARQRYENTTRDGGESLWAVGSNLMIAIVLFELQERFMIFLNSTDESFFEVPQGVNPREHLLAAVQKRARTYLSYIPPEFFAINWATKSLSTGAGRDVLQAALRSLVESNGRFVFRKSRLVTGID